MYTSYNILMSRHESTVLVCVQIFSDQQKLARNCASDDTSKAQFNLAGDGVSV